ncbi:hypothetical protein PCANB_000227 [Pneumocystis canis]|nr:hypothetical protein PCANB_000227 [Pneumocystis canis]
MDPVLFFRFQNQLYDSLVSTTKAVVIIGSQDIDFYRTLDPYFALSLADCNKRLLDLANFFIQFVSLGKFGKIEEHEDFNYRWLDIVDMVDSLFEKADMLLNEFNELVKQSDYKIEKKNSKDLKRKKLAYKYTHAENISRPQLRFSTVPDNDSNTPWRRKITVKPNALVPLDNSIFENNDKLYKIGIVSHPYEYEINNIKYSEELFKEKVPVDPIPFNNSTVIWVDTVHLLEKMVKNLKETTEIAIDLEHHDYRSYQGFVCLMQISTRSIDWIVDTLELREELEILNEIFTDPNIIKVLHGASMDIIWLQRDFGLYIVGLFDTYHAARVLGFEGYGLAFLLKKYVNFDSDKQYQLADWRIRPLPEEMLSYARSDTHFLLYIYDQLKNELLLKSTSSQNLLLSVLSASNNVALRVFEKDKYDADGLGVDGWKNILQKWSNCLKNDLQVSVLIALHRWRDKIARKEDESVRYVLPNQTLVQIAVSCPEDATSVLATCNHVPPLVRVYVDEIVQIIQLAKDQLKNASLLNKLNVVSNSVNMHFPNNSTILEDIDFINHDKLFQKNIIDAKLIHFVTKSSIFWSEVIENYNIEDTKLFTVGKILKDMRLTVPLPSFLEKVFLDDDYTFTNEDNLVSNKNDQIDKLAIERDDSDDIVYRSFVEKSLEQQKQNQDNSVIVVKKLGNKQKRLLEIFENKSEDMVIEKSIELFDEFDKSSLLLNNSSSYSKERKKKKKLNRKIKSLEKVSNHNENPEPYNYEKDISFFDQLNNNYELKNQSWKVYEEIKVNNKYEEQIENPKCQNAPKSGFRSMVFGK